MTSTKRFEDLEVWQKAKELANLVYKFSPSGEFAQDYGLRDQMRRVAVSVMSNIAEGFESQTQVLFIQFLGRAKGSAGEVRAQLYVAKDQGYLTEEQFNSALSLAEVSSKQLTRFIQYLQTQPNTRLVWEDGETYDAEH
ncbi:MAG: four helix bundle protein [Chloroflexi bacterium]|nr:four helix bundle protein [Chloroflexota bacterium]MBI3338583.1 four helix bundle protein [Chloroflexota bacterium]